MAGDYSDDRTVEMIVEMGHLLHSLVVGQHRQKRPVGGVLRWLLVVASGQTTADCGARNWLEQQQQGHG